MTSRTHRFGPDVVPTLSVDHVLLERKDDMIGLEAATPQHGCTSVCVASYRWVLGAAGKRDATLFPAGIPVGAVEVDVQVPVVDSKSPTALPLET